MEFGYNFLRVMRVFLVKCDKKIVFFLFLFFSSFCLSFSQGKKIFFLNEGTAFQNKFVQDNSLTTYVNISQGYFVTNGRFSAKGLEHIINKYFPDKQTFGYAVLDWEGDGMQALVRQNSEFNFYIEQFNQALAFAKKLRPNVKWGYYGLPYKFYESSLENYSNKIERLGPLIKNLDFIAPSLYILNNEPISISEKQKIDATLSISLKFASKFRKPVYPFIWHRVHPSNKLIGISLIDNNVFDEYIRYFSKFKYKNISISGLFWWHSENYSFKKKATDNQIGKVYSSVANFENFEKKIFYNYLKILRKDL